MPGAGSRPFSYVMSRPPTGHAAPPPLTWTVCVTSPWRQRHTLVWAVSTCAPRRRHAARRRPGAHELVLQPLQPPPPPTLAWAVVRAVSWAISAVGAVPSRHAASLAEDLRRRLSASVSESRTAERPSSHGSRQLTQPASQQSAHGGRGARLGQLRTAAAAARPATLCRSACDPPPICLRPGPAETRRCCSVRGRCCVCCASIGLCLLPALCRPAHHAPPPDAWAAAARPWDRLRPSPGDYRPPDAARVSPTSVWVPG